MLLMNENTSLVEKWSRFQENNSAIYNNRETVHTLSRVYYNCAKILYTYIDVYLYVYIYGLDWSEEVPIL
jgi:hypothetical protein